MSDINCLFFIPAYNFLQDLFHANVPSCATKVLDFFLIQVDSLDKTFNLLIPLVLLNDLNYAPLCTCRISWIITFVTFDSESTKTIGPSNFKLLDWTYTPSTNITRP